MFNLIWFVLFCVFQYQNWSQGMVNGIIWKLATSLQWWKDSAVWRQFTLVCYLLLNYGISSKNNSSSVQKKKQGRFLGVFLGVLPKVSKSPGSGDWDQLKYKNVFKELSATRIEISRVVIFGGCHSCWKGGSDEKFKLNYKYHFSKITVLCKIFYVYVIKKKYLRVCKTLIYIVFQLYWSYTMQMKSVYGKLSHSFSFLQFSM